MPVMMGVPVMPSRPIVAMTGIEISGGPRCDIHYPTSC
jgi:hypothetical protein